MYDNKAVETLTEAVLDIIIPKINTFIADKKLDTTLEKEIEDVVSEIEQYEDLIDNMLLQIPKLSDKISDETISIGGWYFAFNKETEMFSFPDDILQAAKSKVYNKHKLYLGWESTKKIKKRIAAIITTMDDTTFENIVTKIEKDINFNDFLSQSYGE